jgi:hypothetical protein
MDGGFFFGGKENVEQVSELARLRGMLNVEVCIKKAMPPVGIAFCMQS